MDSLKICGELSLLLLWYWWTTKACTESEVGHLRVFARESLNPIGAQGLGRIFESFCFIHKYSNF